MTSRTKTIAALCLCAHAVLSAQPMSSDAKLRSPWDAQSVPLGATAYLCPALAPLPRDIEASDFYSDPKHSVIDEKKQAAYKAAEEQFQDTMAAVAKAADEFRATGDPAAAMCVLQVLDGEAAAQAMTGRMSTNQAQYVQNWTLGALAVDWLKVREAKPGTESQRTQAIAWMSAVGRQVRVWFIARHNKQTKDGTNNHFYWAGFAAAGAGIAADDRTLFNWGITTYTEALSRVQPDGTLPLEMDRGQRALHYHLFALAPIVMLAEFGEANGRHLYSERNGAVHTLVRRTVEGLRDNSYFAKQAGVAQDTPEQQQIKSTDVIWLVPYLQRFPDPAMTRLLRSTALRPYNYLGGYPPSWTKQQQPL